MKGRGPKSVGKRKHLLCLFAFALLAGVSTPKPLVAAETAAPAWNPATPAMVANLKAVMDSGILASVVLQEPPLERLANLDANSAIHREVVGATAAPLPDGRAIFPLEFESRPEDFRRFLTKVLASPASTAALQSTIAMAYQKAKPLVASEVDSRAESIVADLAKNTLGVEELAARNDELREYSLYGDVVTNNRKVRALARIVAAARDARTLDTAKKWAINLARGWGIEAGLPEAQVTPPEYMGKVVLPAIPQLPAADSDEEFMQARINEERAALVDPEAQAFFKSVVEHLTFDKMLEMMKLAETRDSKYMAFVRHNLRQGLRFQGGGGYLLSEWTFFHGRRQLNLFQQSQVLRRVLAARKWEIKKIVDEERAAPVNSEAQASFKSLVQYLNEDVQLEMWRLAETRDNAYRALMDRSLRTRDQFSGGGSSFLYGWDFHHDGRRLNLFQQAQVLKEILGYAVTRAQYYSPGIDQELRSRGPFRSSNPARFRSTEQRTRGPK